MARNFDKRQPLSPENRERDWRSKDHVTSKRVAEGRSSWQKKFLINLLKKTAHVQTP